MEATLKRRHTISCDVTLCSLVQVYQRFGETYCVHLQEGAQRVHFVGLLFETKNEGNMFLRNVGKLLPASYHRIRLPAPDLPTVQC
jgi:hypothetical protein